MQRGSGILAESALTKHFLPANFDNDLALALKAANGSRRCPASGGVLETNPSCQSRSNQFQNRIWNRA